MCTVNDSWVVPKQDSSAGADRGVRTWWTDAEGRDGRRENYHTLLKHTETKERIQLFATP